MSNIRISDCSLAVNDELMTKQLDLLEKHREMATIWQANYQQKMAQRYDKGVRSREFYAGDLVLCKAVEGARTSTLGSLP